MIVMCIFCFRLILSQTTNFRLFQTSKLKDFAVDNFKFVGNAGKFSGRVENTVGKRNFSFYRSVFNPFPHTMTPFDSPGKQAF